MRKITITAKTEAGKEALTQQGQQSNKAKIACKMIGLKEEVINKEPLTIVITIKIMPMSVFLNVLFTLQNKFTELGAIKDIDYTMVWK